MRAAVHDQIHLRVNAAGLPMRSDGTPGRTPEHLGFDLVMADKPPAPGVLPADRGHHAESIRKAMEPPDDPHAQVT